RAAMGERRTPQRARAKMIRATAAIIVVAGAATLAAAPESLAQVPPHEPRSGEGSPPPRSQPPRAHANSRDSRPSPSAVLDNLPGALHLRVPGPRARARMHLLARGGKSPEWGGHRSQDALLVAAGTRSRPLITRA